MRAAQRVRIANRGDPPAFAPVILLGGLQSTVNLRDLSCFIERNHQSGFGGLRNFPNENRPTTLSLAQGALKLRPFPLLVRDKILPCKRNYHKLGIAPVNVWRHGHGKALRLRLITRGGRIIGLAGPRWPIERWSTRPP